MQIVDGTHVPFVVDSRHCDFSRLFPMRNHGHRQTGLHCITSDQRREKKEEKTHMGWPTQTRVQRRHRLAEC